MRNFDIGYNDITSIESMSSLNASELKRLDLEHNALTEVQAPSIVSLSYETELNFKSNSITRVNLTGVNIRKMSFEKNQISVVRGLPQCDVYVVPSTHTFQSTLTFSTHTETGLSL